METSIQIVGIDSYGELEVKITINDHVGIVYVSKEMWKAFDNKAKELFEKHIWKQSWLNGIFQSISKKKMKINMDAMVIDDFAVKAFKHHFGTDVTPNDIKAWAKIVIESTMLDVVQEYCSHLEAEAIKLLEQNND